MYSLVSTLYKSSQWPSVKRTNTVSKSAYWIGYLNEILLGPLFVCSPNFTALQYINNLETQRSPKTTFNLKNLDFLKKIYLAV